MSYIDKIRKNVAETLIIRKKAKSENIDYLTAKIMYHNGANDVDLETARDIKNALEEAHVPVRMIDKFDLIGSYSFEKRSTDDINDIIYREVYNKVKRKNIEELKEFFWADEYYGEYIYNLVKKGFPLNVATQVFEIKLKYEMKKNNLSELAALANILYYENVDAAKLFEKAYLNKRAIHYYPMDTIKDEIMFDDEYKKKIINGITIVSKTDKGLKKLENVITEVFKTGNSELIDLLPKLAKKNNLMLSDMTFTKTKNSHYASASKCIYLDGSDKTLSSAVITFYHEVTHFLDNIKGSKSYTFYSGENSIVNLLLEKIGEIISPIQRGLSLEYLTNLNAQKYISNSKLNQKWQQEIKEKFPNLSEEDYKILMQQKRFNERKKFKLIQGYLTDIYDSLTGGKLFTYFCVQGHGKKYYEQKDNILAEFFANIGLLYNANEMDILRFEFGDELVEQLIDMYRKFMNSDEYEVHKK